MSFEEEFDRIIRQKSEDLKYPLDEKNWEAARRMIDADRERSPRAGFFRVYSPAIILTLIGLGALVIVNNVMPPGTKIMTSQPEQSLESPHAVKSSDVLANEGVANSHDLLKPADVNAVKENQPVPETTIHQATGGSAQVSSKSAGVKAQPADPAKVDEQNTLSSGNQALPSGIVTAISEPVVTVTGNNDSKTEVPAYMAPLHMFLPFISRQNEVSAGISVKKDDDYYEPAANKRHLLDLSGGAAFLNGWHTNAGTDARGFNWYAGINYGFCLGSRWILGTGLLAYSVGNIKKPFYAATQMEYDFVSVTSQTIVTANALYYVAVPLMVYYNISKNSRVGGGVNASFLTGSHNTLNTYKVQDGSNTLQTSTRNFGRYDGVATTSMLLCASYATRLSNRFFVKAEALYGLNDLFNGSLNKNDAENPMGIRVGIQYTLLEK